MASKLNASVLTYDTRIDQVGAHFKFRDLTERLNLLITEKRQEKRSKDLLYYQQYFTQNE